MDSGHYIEKCKHGIVLSQCRCPGPKTEYIIECPAECDAMNLRAQLADRDAEIERLRVDLVWAVRQGVMVGHDENLRTCVWFDVHRGVECDGTPESICRAVREARES